MGKEGKGVLLRVGGVLDGFDFVDWIFTEEGIISIRLTSSLWSFLPLIIIYPAFPNLVGILFGFLLGVLLSSWRLRVRRKKLLALPLEEALKHFKSYRIGYGEIERAELEKRKGRSRLILSWEKKRKHITIGEEVMPFDLLKEVLSPLLGDRLRVVDVG